MRTERANETTTTTRSFYYPLSSFEQSEETKQPERRRANILEILDNNMIRRGNREVEREPKFENGLGLGLNQNKRG